MDVGLYESLDGQTALVTGGTRGIGAEIAAQLTDLGATVYAGARTPADVTAGDQRAVELDVTDDDTIAATVDRIETDSGRLDVLVNNAGIGGPESPLHEAGTEGIDETIRVNLRGPAVVTKHALPLLLDQRGSRVVNVSSGMGALGEGMSGGSPAYRVTKSGLNGLTAYLHGEYNGEELLANSVCPGWVRTDMGGPNASRSVEKGAETPVWLARFESDAPSGRFWRDKESIEW